MKKIFLSITLIFFLTITTSSISFAHYNNQSQKLSINDSQANYILEKNFSKAELMILEAERKEQDKIEAENGFTNRTTNVIVSKPQKNYGTYSNNKIGIGDSIYYVTVVDTYTGREEVLNELDKRFGLAHWLDVSWNVAIGTQTKYFWIAATVIGVNPSDFSSNYKRGEKLSSTKTKVVSRRCYKKYNPTRRMDVWYLETQNVTIKNYVDLYAFDKNNNSIRKSNTDTKTFYSEHYFDTNWIKDYVNRACKLDLFVKTDKIK